MGFISAIKERRDVSKRRKSAQESGSFWLECPLCKQPFGGNEVYSGSESPWIEHQDLPGYGQLICPRCTKQGFGDEAFTKIFQDHDLTSETGGV